MKIYQLLIALIISVILLNGCSKDECKVNSDCPQAKCRIGTCSDGMCKFTNKPNCCGNRVEEKTEDAQPGNKCTCPEDYGECEGKGKLKVRNRLTDAKYMEYFCTAQKECVFGVDPEEIVERTLVDEKSLKYFLLETQISYDEPFNVLTEKISFQIKLKNTEEGLILPINITNMQLKKGGILMGEQSLSSVLSSIGETINIEVPVDYRPDLIEEQFAPTFKIDYTYVASVRTTRNQDGTYNYEDQTFRESYEKGFASSIFFVNPEGESAE